MGMRCACLFLFFFTCIKSSSSVSPVEASKHTDTADLLPRKLLLKLDESSQRIYLIAFEEE